ncbi:MAG: flippase-like domain-containing protein [Nitrospirae bacterium]|nr:flippase-like domain-containing protein [Nitrospirota bacterium]
MSWPPTFKDAGFQNGVPLRRRWLTTAVKTIISLGLLAYFFATADLQGIGDVLRNYHGGYFTLALLGYIVLQFAGVLRWRILAQVQGYGHAFGQLTAFYFSGLFFNLFLPTSIGGDLGRCYYLAGDRSDLTRAMTTIVADRIGGMVAVICIAAAAILAGGSIAVPLWLMTVAVGGAGLLILGLLIPFAIPVFFRRFGMPFRYWERPRVMLTSLGLSFFIQLSIVVIHMLIGRAVGVGIPWGFYFVFTPLVMMAGMIPVSLNGLGVREGAYVYFFVQADVSTAHALTFAVTWLIIITTTSLLGGVVWILTSRSLSTAKT